VEYTYQRGTRPAVRGVSLTLNAGEVVVVAGESGSGKSTVARIAAGLLQPQAGVVRVDGSDLRGRRRRGLAGRVGIVFQHPSHQLLASTVREELELGPRNLGLGAPEIDARVREGARRFGLAAVLDEHPHRLPMPARRRLSIASITVMRPPVLVLDEPTAGLDGAETIELIELIREASGRGRMHDAEGRPSLAVPTSVLVVTHDLRFAGLIADRVVVLRDGRLVAEGPPDAMLADVSGLGVAGLEAPPLVRVAAARGIDPALGVAGPGDALVAAIRASAVRR
jgi:energy-coupling factor transporter ATP-binding protein EcfA2